MPDPNTGRFVWYDLLSTEPEQAMAFYAYVVGWTTQPLQPGVYTMFASAQGPHAGTAKLPDEARKMGAPPHWTSNVRVADVDATIARARDLGGRVVSQPNDFPSVGRLAVIADPQGASINIFAPTGQTPDHDRTKPGEFTWHELLTSDHEAALRFYCAIFGWQRLRDFDMGAMGTYLIFGREGKDLGGMCRRSGDSPAPPAWLYYVQVADLDAAVERAKTRGGKLLNGPMPVPGGARIAQLVDPQGAAFALHEAAK
jgi:predicted enzyme related to lactoylglutathione lyase